MTKQEFSNALELANSNKHDITNVNVLFYGFGLKNFEPVTCTLKDIAGLIVYQCKCFNGSLDMEALNEIWKFKRKFIVV